MALIPLGSAVVQRDFASNSTWAVYVLTRLRQGDPIIADHNPTKRETAKVVPTWNYAVVHAHGALRVIDDRAWLQAFVENLTNRHEVGRRAPWKLTDAPSDFTDKQLGAIIGLEIPITRLIGKWKVSQNRSARDRDGVVEGLLQAGHDSAVAMAGLVRRSHRE